MAGCEAWDSCFATRFPQQRLQSLGVAVVKSGRKFFPFRLLVSCQVVVRHLAKFDDSVVVSWFYDRLPDG